MPSPDGRYLYFTSARNVNPILGSRDWDNVEARNEKPYLVLLRKDVKNPLADIEGLPGEDESKKKDGDADKEKSGKEGDKGEKKSEAPKPVEIDFDGIADRVVMFPGTEFGNYGGVSATQQIRLEDPSKAEGQVPKAFCQTSSQASGSTETSDVAT